MQLLDMPWSKCSLTPCPCQDVVLRHALSRCSLSTYSGRDTDLWHTTVPTCPGQYTFLRRTSVGMQFNDIPDQNAVLRHALVGMQLFDMPLVRTQLFAMLASEGKVNN